MLGTEASLAIALLRLLKGPCHLPRRKRDDNLPRTFVATNAVAAMDANREQAILPTFMDVVAKPGPHSSPAASASLEQEGPEVHGFDARRSRK